MHRTRSRKLSTSAEDLSPRAAGKKKRKKAARPTNLSRHDQQKAFDDKLARHLNRNVHMLPEWLASHNYEVERRLQFLSWQPWSTDNQIIASVQTLMEECAGALGREKLQWIEPLAHKHSGTAPSAARVGPLLRKVLRGGSGRLGLARLAKGLRASADEAAADDKGELLLVCDVLECGGDARMLQDQFSRRLKCKVLISSDSIATWRAEVAFASRGVVLLQTANVLWSAPRLLQLFEATQLDYAVVCVNVNGGGYDFGAVKPFLDNLRTSLPEHEMFTLRSELASASCSVGQLVNRLRRTVPNSISVFFNPGGAESMVDGAIHDIIDTLKKSQELLNESEVLRKDGSSFLISAEESFSRLGSRRKGSLHSTHADADSDCDHSPRACSSRPSWHVSLGKRSPRSLETARFLATERRRSLSLAAQHAAAAGERRGTLGAGHGGGASDAHGGIFSGLGGAAAHGGEESPRPPPIQQWMGACTSPRPPPIRPWAGLGWAHHLSAKGAARKGSLQRSLGLDAADKHNVIEDAISEESSRLSACCPSPNSPSPLTSPTLMAQPESSPQLRIVLSSKPSPPGSPLPRPPDNDDQGKSGDAVPEITVLTQL